MLGGMRRCKGVQGGARGCEEMCRGCRRYKGVYRDIRGCKGVGPRLHNVDRIARADVHGCAPAHRAQ